MDAGSCGRRTVGHELTRLEGRPVVNIVHPLGSQLYSIGVRHYHLLWEDDVAAAVHRCIERLGQGSSQR